MSVSYQTRSDWPELLPYLTPRERVEWNRLTQSLPPTFSQWLPTVTPQWTWDWVYQLYIQHHLQRVTNGEIDRLMLFVPPRHTKSEMVTIRYPVWRIKRNPLTRVIIAAHGQILASKFSRRAMQIARTQMTLARETADDWETPEGGGVRAVGVGGSITGVGGNCLPAGTLINTEIGPVDIERLCELYCPPRVVAFDHATGRMVLRKITATSRRTSNDIYEIHTAKGKRLRATANHRVFVSGSGYKETALLSPGDRLVSCDNLPSMRRAQIQKEQVLSGLLSGSQETESSAQMCMVRRDLRERGVCARTGATEELSRHLLLSRMSQSASSREKRAAMCGMWHADAEPENPQVLFSRMPEDGTSKTIKAVSLVQRELCAESEAPTILFVKLRGCGTCSEDDREREFALQDWDKLFQMVCGDAPLDYGSGQACLSGLSRDGSSSAGSLEGADCTAHQLGGSSYRRRPYQQWPRQPDNAMQEMSLTDSQIQEDEVALVRPVRGGSVGVYDLQVEGCHNFFANNLLVHNCIIIDDPVKGRAQAESETYRDLAYDWYTNDIYTRLEPGGQLVLIQCMTGDTPVLMADGTELPLREIRAGNQVATYDKGKLGTARVQNHKSNGHDSVFKITMACGKTIRANERHPFLAEDQGEIKWIRLKNLTTAHRIVSVRDSGASGRARYAPSKDAKSLSDAGDTARHTIARKCGLMGIGLRRLTQNHTETRTLSIATELLPKNTMRCLRRKMANALSANNRPGKTYAHIGQGNCVLTTATRQTLSEDFCATTAISPWDTPRQKRSHLPLPNISAFTTEAITSIELAGIEEVFDLQIERTENFIANGLVSHNTRWHEADLAGRILASEEGPSWTVISLPAEAEENDPLGRAVGEALCPARYNEEALARIKRTLGTYNYSALYQQRPMPAEGGMFQRDWLPIIPAAPAEFDAIVRYWDKGATAGGGDYTAGALFGKVGNRYFVLDVVRGRWSTDQRETVIKQTAMTDQEQYKNAVVWLEEEGGSGGKDSSRATVQNLAGFTVKTERPTGAKPVRAEPFAAQAEAGNVSLVEGRWNAPYINELTSFPFGAHDDQVDASSGAFNKVAFARAKVRAQTWDR
jgi:predicted phage terminase large subunit-like protein